MIIGITGTDGSGKGTVVHYLQDHHGYVHYSSRSFIAEEVVRQGLPLDRNQLRLTANELRARFGDDVIVKKAYERMATEGRTLVIIESIRALAEAKYLKAHGGVLLAVDAAPEIRYERVQARRSETDKVTYEQFLAHEELEKNDPDPHGMQKAKVMEMADYTITNNGSLEELQAAVEVFLKTIGK